jgi:hypothetical protein
MGIWAGLKIGKQHQHATGKTAAAFPSLAPLAALTAVGGSLRSSGGGFATGVGGGATVHAEDDAVLSIESMILLFGVRKRIFFLSLSLSLS